MNVDAQLPLECPDRDTDHGRDQGMVSHGTRENPVVVKEPRIDKGQYVAWEYAHVGKILGPVRRCVQFLTNDGEKVIDRIVFRTSESVHHVFYFDITSQFRSGMEEIEKIARAMGVCPRCREKAPNGDHPDCQLLMGLGADCKLPPPSVL